MWDRGTRWGLGLVFPQGTACLLTARGLLEMKSSRLSRGGGLAFLFGIILLPGRFADLLNFHPGLCGVIKQTEGSGTTGPGCFGG